MSTPNLCIGGPLDGEQLVVEDGRRCVAVPERSQPNLTRVPDAATMQEMTARHVHYVRETLRTPRRTFTFWRLEEDSLEHAILALFDGYAKSRGTRLS